MPIYEYECAACGERLERLQKMGDSPLVECPACGQRALRRLISRPAFQFKGSGWYVTDYARKGGEKGKEKEGESTEATAADATKTGGGDDGKRHEGEKKDKKEAKEPAPAKAAPKGES